MFQVVPTHGGWEVRTLGGDYAEVFVDKAIAVARVRNLIMRRPRARAQVLRPTGGIEVEYPQPGDE